jgi:hypothetical protein
MQSTFQILGQDLRELRGPLPPANILQGSIASGDLPPGTAITTRANQK